MGLFDFITDIISKKNKAKAVQDDLSINAKSKSKKQTPTSDAKLKVGQKKGKERKKSHKISSAPVNKQALGFSISLKDGGHARKRQAIRIVLDGLEVFVHRLKKKFPATNISATGLGFAFEKPRIKGGVKLMVDLIFEEQIVAEQVQCKVMRHEQGSVGCLFVELDRPQDDAVHKLVLLGQKQQAQRKKRGMKAEPKPTKL